MRDRGLLNLSVEDVGQGRELDFMIAREWDHMRLCRYTAQWDVPSDPSVRPVGIIPARAFRKMLADHFSQRLGKLYELFIAASTLLYDYQCDYELYKTHLSKDDALFLLLRCEIAAIRELDNLLRPTSLERSVEGKMLFSFVFLRLFGGWTSP
jgi:hypothetical protein